MGVLKSPSGNGCDIRLHAMRPSLLPQGTMSHTVTGSGIRKKRGQGPSLSTGMVEGKYQGKMQKTTAPHLEICHLAAWSQISSSVVKTASQRGDHSKDRWLGGYRCGTHRGLFLGHGDGWC